ncbi:MAG: hypothetical protein WA741_32210 [Candidatus Sulfotelmatobacter sp.]
MAACWDEVDRQIAAAAIKANGVLDVRELADIVAWLKSRVAYAEAISIQIQAYCDRRPHPGAAE